MTQRMCWIKFQAEPPRLDLLDQIPSNTFNIIFSNIVVGSHSQQNLQPYMIQHIRIKFPAKPPSLCASTSLLDQIPSKTFNIMNQRTCCIRFPADRSTLYASTYLLDQIPSKTLNSI